MSERLLRSFAAAVAGVLHPKMLLLTLLPALVSACLWGAVFWFGWESLAELFRGWLGASSWGASLGGWAGTLAGAGMHLVLVPFLIVVCLVPLIVITTLVISGAVSMPVVIAHLSRRRYAGLARVGGGGFWLSLWHSLWVTLICLVLLVLSMPLWLIPPFFAILPPLLWGWLTYRVMSFDALAEHASVVERVALMREHRWPLLSMGIACGLASTLPGLLWAGSVLFIVLFPIFALLAIWLYVFIFVFSALWFAHYCLHALERSRRDAAVDVLPSARIG